MKTSILIATYGDEAWRDLAWSRAYPSAVVQEAHEVLVRHETDATISEVRNALGKEASGEWLLFLDADDELSPSFLAMMQRTHEKLRSPPKRLYTPEVSYVHISGRRRPARHLRRGNLQNDNYLVVGTLIERSLFMEVGGFGEYPHGFEDWSLWAKCWKAGAKVVPVRGAIYYAYMNPESKHRKMWKNREWQVEMHHRVRRDIFPELYPENVC